MHFICFQNLRFYFFLCYLLYCSSVPIRGKSRLVTKLIEVNSTVGLRIQFNICFKGILYVLQAVMYLSLGSLSFMDTAQFIVIVNISSRLVAVVLSHFGMFIHERRVCVYMYMFMYKKNAFISIKWLKSTKQRWLVSKWCQGWHGLKLFILFSSTSLLKKSL